MHFVSALSVTAALAAAQQQFLEPRHEKEFTQFDYGDENEMVHEAVHEPVIHFSEHEYGVHEPMNHYAEHEYDVYDPMHHYSEHEYDYYNPEHHSDFEFADSSFYHEEPHQFAEHDSFMHHEPEFHHEQAHANGTGSCWLKAYGRGVGKPISTCPAGKERNGALCYPLCKAGFNGVGPVCWSVCPDGFRNDGAFCAKPGPYGRGVGKIRAFDNSERCLALWYPKCKTGYHNVGCNICSPNCPSGMKDIGVSCAKMSYGRTAGTPLTCKPGEELGGALCYPPCKSGTKGIGPVCWGSCPAGTTRCGALCMASGENCANYVLGNFKNMVNLVAAIAEGDIKETAISVADVAEGYIFPTCSSY